MTTVHRPATVVEAQQVLEDCDHAGDRALVVAGGSIVLPEMGRSAKSPRHLVDLWWCGLDRTEILRGVDGSDRLRLGAMVTYQQVLDDTQIARRLPLLHQLCSGITGGLTLRSQATLVGSVCAARPYSDLPSAVVALDATVRVRHAGGVREVAMSAFLTGAERTALRPGELVEAVDVPLPPPDRRARHQKVKSAEGSWPVVTVSAQQSVGQTRLAIGGVAGTPVVLMVGDDRPIEDVRAAVAAAVGPGSVGEPWQDIRADAGYRRAVAIDVACAVLTEMRSAPRPPAGAQGSR